MLVRRESLVPYPPSLMYALVLDVMRYPEFLPWCARAQVLEQTETRQLARLTLQHSRLTQSFTTENRLVTDREISIHLVEGPFESLNGVWRFDAIADYACKVQLNLNFVPRSLLSGVAVGAIFPKAANTMVDSFCQRARQLHAQASDPVSS